MDVYGAQVQFVPHSLNFFARATRPKPNKRIIRLKNNGSGVLPQAMKPKVKYSEGRGWLIIEHEGGQNSQQLVVGVDATDLVPGQYSAQVQVETPGAVNGKQNFLVQLTIPTYPPAHEEMRDVGKEIIDNSDKKHNRFYSTPYFWVAPRFKRWNEKGVNDFYLTNGGRAAENEFARFTPDLEGGKYKVSFAQETPFDPERRAMTSEGQQLVNEEYNPDPRFSVRVRSKNGDEIIWVEPTKSKEIGTFFFEEGMDGFVEILAEGSTGQILVDAIIFEKLE
jgi:hypothetical protein